MMPEKPKLPEWRRLWGEATALLRRARRLTWADWLLLAALAGLLLGISDLAREWFGPHRPVVEIELTPWAIPRYLFYSLARGLLAYGISLIFTLLYGYWAAKDRLAERVLIPLLDILQSIPVLSFLPGLVLGLSAAFPNSNVGLELASVLMIFTGQAWNMTFSYYHSLRTLPRGLEELALTFRFTGWQRWKWLELPFATVGLVWNSMMSMAGGWFFLMICESYRLGEKDFRLPGLGSYMSVAVEQGRWDAMLWALLAMAIMIIGLDQLLWQPLAVWAQRFRMEESAVALPTRSWFLDWLRRTRLAVRLRRWLSRRRSARLMVRRHPPTHRLNALSKPAAGVFTSLTALILLLALLGFGAWKLLHLLVLVEWASWMELAEAALYTVARVFLTVALGTVLALPAGLAIGLSPRLSRWLQPVAQILASFPAPMLFPVIIAALRWTGISLQWGSIALMLLGTVWYILFNVLAGTMAIPTDLRELVISYRFGTWHRFRALYLPAVFPYLVTGWITAAGGAWNTSIVAEYVEFRGEVLQARGLGALISRAAEEADFPLLAAGVLVMGTLVVLINRFIWHRLSHLAETKYSLQA